MKHYSYSDIVELAKVDPRKSLRLHWEGEQAEAKQMLAVWILDEIAEGSFTAKEFDEMGYCVSEEDYQAEKDEAAYQGE